MDRSTGKTSLENGLIVRDMFNLTLNDIANVLVQVKKTDPRLTDIMNWYKDSLYYNLTGGKQNRGMILVNTYMALMGIEGKTVLPDEKNNIKLACILGWVVEMLQAFMLVIDDIQDDSPTRRGKPSWFKYEKQFPYGTKREISLMAINDGLMLETGAFQLLNIFFKDYSYYGDLMALVTSTIHQTATGQGMDLLYENKDGVDLEAFTILKHSAIVQYKTSYYSFCMPVRCAMYLAGITDKFLHDQAENILLKIGNHFQIQDDFIDCYGDLALTGKIGTDIQDGKCTWLVATACKLANQYQRHQLEKFYGKPDMVSVQVVKQVYAELGMEGLYDKFEKASFTSITQTIQEEVQDEVLQGIYMDCLHMIGGRKH